MVSSAFIKFWQNDIIRDCLLSHTLPDDFPHLRLVCHSFADLIAPRLFGNLVVQFTSITLSRQARLAAFSRIGRYVNSLSFVMLHGPDTFLPPLLAPDTLDEVNFIYEPRNDRSRPLSATSSSSSSSSTESQFGSWEVEDLLVKQYPPLFHSATNVPAFVQMFSVMSNLKTLTLSCPRLASTPAYRRDVVDYALISLRIAIEQANPVRLRSLYLDSVSPEALLYLRPQLSFGVSPASTRVWHRITKLNISMQSFACDRDVPADRLKILHTYLQSFSKLEELDFRWVGTKGPCPLSLDTEPCTSRPASLDCANACPQSCLLPSCKPLKYRSLKRMRLGNASFDSNQAASFITTHRKVLEEFEFDGCHLRSGTWDEALAPLSRITGNDDWKKRQEEVMDVPIMLSPVNTKREVDFINSQLWEDRPKHRGMQILRRVGLRTKEMLPGQFKRVFRSPRVGWP